MKKTARRFGSYDPSPTVVPAVETPTRIVRDPCAIEVNDDLKGRFTVNNNEKKPDHEWAQRHAVAVAEAAIPSGLSVVVISMAFFALPKWKRATP